MSLANDGSGITETKVVAVIDQVIGPQPDTDCCQLLNPYVT